jgi:adenylate kinase family enzyme
VYGPSGSGKSTVARQIGGVLNLPVVELDSLFHGPNWNPTPEDEFRRKVRDALDRRDGGWVCDGNYSFVRDLTLPLADTVVWLRLPFRVAYWRLLKRTITRFWTKELLWGTNRESFRQSFLSRDSILLWGITHWRAHFRNVRQSLKEISHRAALVELYATRDVSEFLESLTASSEGR